MERNSRMIFYEALTNVQAEMPIIGKNRIGRFKYADLAEIFYIAFPILTKHGFSVRQDGVNHNDMLIIKTVLCHKGGHYEESLWPVPQPAVEEYKGRTNFMQAYMGNATFIKRYAFISMLGIATSDEDYDGEYVAPQPSPSLAITAEQLEQLEYELNGYPQIVEMILKNLNIKTLSQMPKATFLRSIERIREIKKTASSK